MLSSESMWLIVLAAALALGLGALRFNRRRAAAPGRTLDRNAADRPAQHQIGLGKVSGAYGPGALDPRCAGFERVAVAGRALCTRFLAWLGEQRDATELWAAFDQFVRETLRAHLGATRIRCFHVQPGSDPGAPLLQAIHHAGRKVGPEPFAAQPTNGSCTLEAADSGGAPGVPSRDGLLEHVVTTGKEYWAHDPSHGPLLDDLAARAMGAGRPRWLWAWPVRTATRGGNTTLGIVAVGELRDPDELTSELRLTVGTLLSLCWQHVDCVQRLRTVQRTDHASGVLTRNEFFAFAQRALSDSYAANEPLVVAVLALEGLRRLDDTRYWHERDALVACLGALIRGRTRSDDIVGRFADDRFVVLLRRLDSALGRLIAEQLLAAGEEHIAALAPSAPELHGRIRLRIGLAGSGLTRPPLTALMASAFDAVERARKQDVAIEGDGPPAPGAPGQAVGARRAGAPGSQQGPPP